jgi:hypothetical protein
VLFVAAAVIALSLKMANAWQKFVILRMGKLQSVRGAGLFAIIPVLDSVIAVIDGGGAREAGAGDTGIGRGRDRAHVCRGRR